MLDVNEYIKLTLGLLAITVPIAAAAVYLGLSQGFNAKDKRKIIITVSLLYVVILTGFAFLGEQILSFFSISINTFKIAGGALLFLSSLEMMGTKKVGSETNIDTQKASPISVAIVPLGLPLLIGPGAISTIIVYTHMHNTLMHKLFMTGVICTVALIIFWLLWLTDKLSFVFTDSLTSLVNRLLGLILAAMGVEFIFSGAIAQIVESIALL